MTWMPQSLFARLLAALVAVIGATLIVVVLLIVRERHDLAMWGSTAWDAATVIADTSERLAGLRGEKRRAALARLRMEPIEIESTRPVQPMQLSEAFKQGEKTFARQLRRQLDDDYTVSLHRTMPRRGDRPIRVIEEWRRSMPGNSSGVAEPADRSRDAASAPTPDSFRGDDRRDRGSTMSTPSRDGRNRWGPRGMPLLDVTVRLPDGEQVVFRTTAPVPGPPMPREIFVQLGVLTVALAVVLFLMTRSVTQPLSELARAADAIGKGEKVPSLKERGARELRDATRAFNTMQERLHRYLDSRTRVLAAMSHDLRTPLTRLRLRAETIEDAVTRERLTADIDEMSLMVNGALGLFKGLNDSEPAVPVRIDEVLSSLQMEFAELGGTVTIAGVSNGPITAKPSALKRCLSNLLHNAVKYGNCAHVEITDGSVLRVKISDEGPGIPEDKLQQVFEPFYRVESSRSRDSGGTGLGLCIARDVADAHGGTIELRNRREGGLQATLCLPRNR